MIIIETFARGCEPKYRPTPPAAIRIDTSDGPID
jgi:phosphatidylserine decarboxylase